MISLMADSGINFNNLGSEGYAAFILAIIFTIICIAAAIFVLRRKNISKALGVITVIVVPTLAIFCWVYVISNVCAVSAINSLWIALGSAAGYALVTGALSFIISNVVKANENAKKETKPLTKQENETQVVAPEKIDKE